MDIVGSDSNHGATLSTSDIEFFKENGFVCIRRAVNNDIACHCRNELWKSMRSEGISPTDPTTWVRRKSVGKVFGPSDGYPWSEVVTDKLMRAIDTLCGEGKWQSPMGLGWWTVSFPGYDSDSEWDIEGLWHVDGAHVHFPYNKDIGLTAIMLFSDVKPDLHGATTVLKGSHKYVSSIIAESGFKGLSGYQIKKRLNECDEDWEAQQFTGRAGDVYLMHPLLVHARSKNIGKYGDLSAVRFVCHPAIPLKADMNFCSKDLTPLEQSILEAVPLTDYDGYNPLYYITPENVAEFAESRRKAAEGSDAVGKKRRPCAAGDSERTGHFPIHNIHDSHSENVDNYEEDVYYS